MVKPSVASPPEQQTLGSLLEYRAEIDKSGDFTFILKGNIKKIYMKVFEMIRSIRFSIFIRGFLDNILV